MQVWHPNDSLSSTFLTTGQFHEYKTMKKMSNFKLIFNSHSNQKQCHSRWVLGMLLFREISQWYRKEWLLWGSQFLDKGHSSLRRIQGGKWVRIMIGHMHYQHHLNRAVIGQALPYHTPQLPWLMWRRAIKTRCELDHLSGEYKKHFINDVSGCAAEFLSILFK